MVRSFQIEAPNEQIKPLIIDKIDNLTKPKGSLGTLEEIALQVALIQQTLEPELRKPQNILFAADHGILEEGVSPTPREVTWQQVLHYTRGGAGVNVFCEQHGFGLKVVDAGVDYDFQGHPGVIDMKVRRGTRNFLYEAAMTREELERCMERGAEIVCQCIDEGSNVLSFGEMGAGNTSAASLWMHLFTGIPLEKCVGAGSGLNKVGVQHKLEVLQQALNNYKGNGSVLDIMAYFGGYELVMAVGAMLQAAEKHLIILVDGFLMTACMLAASKLYPHVTDYAIYGHCGDESGHRMMLDALGAKPLLSLGMRLGEGTGAIVAYPILQSALCMLNGMESFKKTEVTKYF
ncbi:MAG: nicotinate-nucleotide--dimethylbenzimidazole phosphoribosyltransferase [Bacteroidaceae bacterium]|nr:nicotinate-nucleotide--dimethylbenzimidazole phosphoribosyltransferase [Bacteroidaceae bacterium]MBQ9499933.1 nicotinate-nucleotide--dimethylbenzimidazole phosphoribosyltransferase [Bacteroidaceae bacterium]